LQSGIETGPRWPRCLRRQPLFREGMGRLERLRDGAKLQSGIETGPRWAA